MSKNQESPLMNIDNTKLEWTSLAIADYGLYQPLEGWRFSIDAVMLAHFAKIGTEEKILDIGCGTGIIGHLMCLYHPNNQFIGIDIEPSVIKLANKSQERNALPCERLSFFVQDSRLPHQPWHAHFDHITANPPFFKVGYGKMSPDEKIARARHELTQTLDDLFKASYFYLKPRGTLWLVHRTERLDEILAIARKYRLKPHLVRPVFKNALAPDSKLSLLSFIKDGNVALKLLNPLYEYDLEGNYNEEINTWYGRKL